MVGIAKRADCDRRGDKEGKSGAVSLILNYFMGRLLLVDGRDG